jgi:hyperosmotically inducible periplasmic protein
MMNRRFDQAIDMAVGAGLMYWFDPKLGKRRRKHLRKEMAKQADLAVSTANAVGQGARQQALSAIFATQTAAKGAMIATQMAAKGAVSATQMAAKDAVLAAQSAAKDAVSTTQAAAKDAVSTTQAAAKDAVAATQTAAKGAIPAAKGAAKLAVFEKLATDEALLDRAKETFSQRGLLPHRSRTRRSTFAQVLGLLIAATIGGALMYFLDSERGAERRARIRDQFTSAGRGAGQTFQGTTNELANRARGIAAETRQSTQRQPVDDETLAERVRSQLGRSVANPGNITVTAHLGRITLTGPVLAGEVDSLLNRVHSVPGVQAVENRLEVHTEPGHVPGLQGRSTTN